MLTDEENLTVVEIRAYEGERSGEVENSNFAPVDGALVQAGGTALQAPVRLGGSTVGPGAALAVGTRPCGPSGADLGDGHAEAQLRGFCERVRAAAVLQVQDAAMQQARTVAEQHMSLIEARAQTQTQLVVAQAHGEVMAARAQVDVERARAEAERARAEAALVGQARDHLDSLKGELAVVNQELALATQGGHLTTQHLTTVTALQTKIAHMEGEREGEARGFQQGVAARERELAAAQGELQSERQARLSAEERARKAEDERARRDEELGQARVEIESLRQALRGTGAHQASLRLIEEERRAELDSLHKEMATSAAELQRMVERAKNENQKTMATLQAEKARHVDELKVARAKHAEALKAEEARHEKALRQLAAKHKTELEERLLDHEVTKREIAAAQRDRELAERERGTLRTEVGELKRTKLQLEHQVRLARRATRDEPGERTETAPAPAPPPPPPPAPETTELEARMTSMQAMLEALLRQQQQAAETAANRVLAKYGLPPTAQAPTVDREQVTVLTRARAAPQEQRPRRTASHCVTVTFSGPRDGQVTSAGLIDALGLDGLHLQAGRGQRGQSIFGYTDAWLGHQGVSRGELLVDLHVEFVSPGARGAFMKAAVETLRDPTRTVHVRERTLRRVDDYLSGEERAARTQYGRPRDVKRVRERWAAERKGETGVVDAWTAWRGAQLTGFVRLQGGRVLTERIPPPSAAPGAGRA